MKLTLFLMCCFVFQLQAAVEAQNQTVSLKVENVSLAEAISQLKKQIKMDFFFSLSGDKEPDYRDRPMAFRPCMVGRKPSDLM